MADPVTTTPVTAAKPVSGFISSEFAATLLTMVSLVIPGIPDKYLPFVIAVSGMYTAARTVLKAVHALGYAPKVPDLPAIPPQLQVPAPGTTTTTITTTPKV